MVSVSVRDSCAAHSHRLTDDLTSSFAVSGSSTDRTGQRPMGCSQADDGSRAARTYLAVRYCAGWDFQTR